MLSCVVDVNAKFFHEQDFAKNIQQSTKKVIDSYKKGKENSQYFGQCDVWW